MRRLKVRAVVPRRTLAEPFAYFNRWHRKPQQLRFPAALPGTTRLVMEGIPTPWMSSLAPFKAEWWNRSHCSICSTKQNKQWKQFFLLLSYISFSLNVSLQHAAVDYETSLPAEWQRKFPPPRPDFCILTVGIQWNHPLTHITLCSRHDTKPFQGWLSVRMDVI